MAIETDRMNYPPFTVTPAAIDELVTLGGAVRVDVEPGGCCGTTFVYEVVDGAVPDEAVLDGAADDADPTLAGDVFYGCPGAWLIVSRAAEEVLVGATLDWSGRVRPPRFRVLANPNTEHVCPCRRSFGTPWPGPRQPTCRAYLPMPWDADYDPPRAWKRQTGYPESGAPAERQHGDG